MPMPLLLLCMLSFFTIKTAGSSRTMSTHYSSSTTVTPNSTNHANLRRVLASKGEVHIQLTIFAAILAGTGGLTLLFYLIARHLLRGGRRRRVLTRNNDSYIEEDPSVRRQISELQSLQLHLQTIEAATNNFSDDNKLGEGGFGPVYKGTLPGGQEIAAKRLSKSSGQGVEEFKTEVELVAKLQHRNLVRLLGFSMERDEIILVYENMPNRSLDRLIFGLPLFYLIFTMLISQYFSQYYILHSKKIRS